MTAYTSCTTICSQLASVPGWALTFVRKDQHRRGHGTVYNVSTVLTAIFLTGVEVSYELLLRLKQKRAHADVIL